MDCCTATVPLGQKIKQLEALISHPDMNLWVAGVIAKAARITGGGVDLSQLNPREVKVIEREWSERFQ